MNIHKYFFWLDWLTVNYNTIQKNIGQIIIKLKNLQPLQQINETCLVPEIKINKYEMQQQLFRQIKKDQLKFKYKWRYWGESENLDLLKYFDQQPKDWILNENTINDLYQNIFGLKFTKKWIRHKCLKFGIEYKN